MSVALLGAGPVGYQYIAHVVPPPIEDDVLPVGSIYIAIVNTDPAISLGYGTWQAFATGRVLIGVDPTNPTFDAPEKTGGALSVAAVGANSQPVFVGAPLGNHQHGAGTYLPSAHSGSAVADHPSHTHSYTQVVDHVHTLATGTTATGNFAQVIGTVDASSGGTGATPTQAALGTRSGNPVGSAGATGVTAGPSATLSHQVTQPANHTMAGNSEAVSAGTPAGTVSAPTFTGAPTSVVQPSIAVFMFKRVA